MRVFLVIENSNIPRYLEMAQARRRQESMCAKTVSMDDLHARSSIKTSIQGAVVCKRVKLLKTRSEHPPVK